MTKTAQLTSIRTTTGQHLDVHTLWHQHVDKWTWIGMGAQPVVYGEDHLSLDIYLGAGTRKRRLIIKLNADDLYDIEVGHLQRRTLDWIIDGQTLNIGVEALDETLRHLYDHLAH